MTKCAFIASGGGMKAYAFHVGVLQALEDQGFRRVMWNDSPTNEDHLHDEIRIGTYIGSSAGACVSGAAIFFKSIDEMKAVIGIGKSQHKVIDLLTMIRRPKLWPPWKMSGLTTVQGMEKLFKQVFLEQDFCKITPQVFVVATQLNNSRKVIFGPRDSGAHNDYNPYIAYYNDVPLYKAVSASMAVPGIFEPYAINNPRSGEPFYYIDGEVRETLSTHIAQDIEMDLAVVSNTWVPYRYQPEIGSISARGVAPVLFQALNQSMEQKIQKSREDNERVKLTLEYLELKAHNLGLSQEQTEELVSGAAHSLNYHPVDEIRVEPSADDTKFNWISPWTFSKKELQFVIDTGYRRAHQAVLEWRKKAAPTEAQNGSK